MENREAEIAGFGNIALAFSGGGYRASAYHLGSLDLLHKVGLLNQVTMLSTVSGGTITGAKYVCALSEFLQNNQPNFFEGFYNELYGLFLNCRLPNLWLDQLQCRHSTKNPSLIVAAAEIYNNFFFNQVRFESLIKSLKKDESHLQEVIFNSTELLKGTGFRFRIIRQTVEGGKIGNQNLNIPRELLSEVRIADVVAASSCFPGGFEPIIFPNNFFKSSKEWNELVDKTRLKFEEKISAKSENKDRIERVINTLKTLYQEPFPLMDGGIYDNLGIATLIRNEKQKSKFSTLIICDTDNIGLSTETPGISKQEALMSIKPPLKGNWFSNIKFWHLSWIANSLFFIFLLSTIAFLLSALLRFNQAHQVTLKFVLELWAVVGFVLLTIIAGIVNQLFQQVSSLSKNSTFSQKGSFIAGLHKIVSDWKCFLKVTGNLSIVDVVNMGSLRLGSINPLFLAFLKGQRRQTYDYVDELKKDREKNVVRNFILETDQWHKASTSGDKDKLRLPDYLIPCSKMAKVSVMAGQIPTTLWFDGVSETAQEEVNNAIACGQFTLCFKLLKLIEEIRNRHPDTPLSPEMNDVYRRLRVAWEQFQSNPHIWVRNNRAQAIEDWNKRISVHAN